MVAALGGANSLYLQMSSLDGFREFHSLARSGRLLSSVLSSYTPGEVLGRLNSQASLTLRGITSSGLVQENGQNLSSSKIQPTPFPLNQSASLFQGIPTSIKLTQSQQSKCTSSAGDFNPIKDSKGLTTVTTSFSNTRVTIGGSSSLLPAASSNSLVLRWNPQLSDDRGAFVNQSSLGVASLTPDPFDFGGGGCSKFLNHNRSNESWQSAVQVPKFSSNVVPLSEPFNHNQFPSNNFVISSTGPCTAKGPNDFSSKSAVSDPLEDSRGDAHCQEGLMGNVV